MKLIILVLFLYTNIAIASHKIVDYRFGNQITGSVLIIYDDGAVKKIERTRPGRIDETLERLNEETLTELLHLIEIVSSFPQRRSSAGSSGNGSSAGYLSVFKNDLKINVRTIEFGDLNGAPQPIIFNTAPEAREIENLIFKMVLIPMTL